MACTLSLRISDNCAARPVCAAKPAAEPRQFLRFAKGQLVGLLASEEERLRGGEGELKPSVVGIDADSTHMFDSISQTVLPWGALSLLT